MSAPDRATRIAASRLVLDLLEADPELPFPAFTPAGIRWSVYGMPCTPLVTRIEAALPCALGNPGVSEGNPNRCVLSGEIAGFPVSVEGWTEDLAERRVTGTRTVDEVEWVRLPAPAQTETETTA